MDVRILGGFWKRRIETLTTRMLPTQWDALNDQVAGAEPSHALENFRVAAGEASGRFHGTIFQDSDVAKWIEAASYSLCSRDDPALQARVDEAIRLIGKAQREDGYVNTYFTVAAPGRHWVDLPWGHELYCAGHLIEAAVAHYECTGKRGLLDIMCRAADHIGRTFGPRAGQRPGCCGHPEIELALFRLFRATGERRYRDLAIHFIDQRGRDPGLFRGRKPHDVAADVHPTRWYMEPDYFSSHQPVRDQRHAEGHAVRAMYLYAAMADACRETGDRGLREALLALWKSAVGRRMYITGAIGSQAHGERFTIDDDLPPDTAYGETCATIGLVFWAHRMAELEHDARYADEAERALYNGVLSGVSLDGTRYFYVNPLEVAPTVAANRFDHAHVKTERVPWFGCSCCPPNIARLIGSIGSYLYGKSDGCPDGGIWVHHYAQSEASIPAASGAVRITQHTDYPWSGRIRLTFEPGREAPMTVHFRIPGWCVSWSCTLNGVAVTAPSLTSGYLPLSWRARAGDEVLLDLEMPVCVMSPAPRIAELAGKVALQRGPLVYCLESCDNGPDLHEIVLDPEGPMDARFDADLMGGAVRVGASGFRVSEAAGQRVDAAAYRPYRRGGTASTPVRLSAVPYHAWGNRAPGGEMRVWLRAKDQAPA